MDYTNCDNTPDQSFVSVKHSLMQLAKKNYFPFFSKRCIKNATYVFIANHFQAGVLYHQLAKFRPTQPDLELQ